jgi:hypothetical protein
MNGKSFAVLVWLLAVGVLPGVAAPERKNNISIEEAMQAVGPVAAQQQFPADFKLVKVGSVRVEGVYYHIFSTQLKEWKKWRTLVYANSGRYLGFYETAGEVSELDASAIIFPKSSHILAGDEEEGILDASDALRIEFTIDGPPDSVALTKGKLLFVSSPVRTPPDNPAYRFLRVAEQLVEAMNSRSYVRIRETFSEASRAKLSEEQTKTAFSSLRQKLGNVEKLDSPWLPSPNTAVFPAKFRRGVFGLKIMLDRNDEIAGLWFLPYDIAFPDIGKHTTTLELPFNSRWQVLWGGDSKADNRYYGSLSQQHALEFVVAGRYGSTHLDEGKRNEDYFAFGRPVLAPAAGEVVGVVQGVGDNRPGTPNPYDALGNMVVIQHATNEFSVLAHLMDGSISVKKGDRVAARQPVGRCGNSGNTTQPRIHMHLQDTPVVQAGAGYRLVFDRVLVWSKGTGRLLEKHTPSRWEYIEQSLATEEPVPARDGVEAEPAGE